MRMALRVVIIALMHAMNGEENMVVRYVALHSMGI